MGDPTPNALTIRRRMLVVTLVLIVGGVLLIATRSAPLQLLGAAGVGLALAVARFGTGFAADIWLRPRLVAAQAWLAFRDAWPTWTWPTVVVGLSAIVGLVLAVRTLLDRGIGGDSAMDFIKGLAALAVTLIALEIVYPWARDVLAWARAALAWTRGNRPTLRPTPPLATALVAEGRTHLIAEDLTGAFAAFSAAVAAEPASEAAWRGLLRVDLALRSGPPIDLAPTSVSGTLDLLDPAPAATLARLYPRDQVWAYPAPDDWLVALADGTLLGRVPLEPDDEPAPRFLVLGRTAGTLRLLPIPPAADIEPRPHPLWRRVLATP